MFSQVSVCRQGGGLHTPWQTPTPPGQTPLPIDRHPAPQQTATAADGTHPTGMHSGSRNKTSVSATHQECPIRHVSNISVSAIQIAANRNIALDKLILYHRTCLCGIITRMKISMSDTQFALVAH